MIDILLYSQCVSSKSSDDRMEKALVNVLLPVMKAVYQKKSVTKIHLFITAEEIKYLEEMHPEVNMFITSLVKQKALVMLTGTYHNINPIFFPQKIIAEDIEKMTTFLRRSYTRRPTLFFPYASLWSQAMFVALGNSGFNEVIFPPLKNLTNYPSGTFFINNMQKTLKIHHASEVIDDYINAYLDNKTTTNEALDKVKSYISNQNDKDDVYIAINLDDFALKDNSLSFLDSLFSYIRLQNESKSDEIVAKNDEENTKYYPPYFLPAGCFSSLSDNLNIQGDILTSKANIYPSRIQYISDILLDNEKKKIVTDRNYLEGMMCSLASSATFFNKYNTYDYRVKRTRDFYDIISSFSSTPLMKYDFMLYTTMCRILLSKTFFALENKGTLLELGIMSKGYNILENGYAFKDAFVQEEDKSVSYVTYKNEELEKKTASDVRETADFNFGYIQKEMHIKSSICTMNISIKNTNKKNFVYSYMPIFLFNNLTGDIKKDNQNITSVRFKIRNSQDTILLSFSKPLEAYESMIEYNENEHTIKFNPKWSIKLKKDEMFDLSITLRYDKGQEEKNDNREFKKV